MINRCIKIFTRDEWIVLAVFGVILVVLPCSMLVAELIRGQGDYTKALIGLSATIVGFATLLFMHKLMKSRSVCISEQGIVEQGWLFKTKRMSWSDVRSVQLNECIQSFSWIRRATPLTSINVKDASGQAIIIPGTAADIEEIKAMLQERLSGDVWQQS